MADISLRIKADFEQAVKAFNSTGYSAEEMGAKVERMAKKLSPEHFDNFNKKLNLSAAAMTATKGPAAAMEMQTRALQREIERLIKAGLSPESSEIQKLKTRYSELAKATDKTSKSTSGFGNIIKGILGANLIQSMISTIGGGFKSIITEAKKLEDAEAAFMPLMGGAEKAKELINQLNIAAAETPFEFQDIAKATKQLLPVMNGDIENTVKTLKMLGDTAGGNAQKLDSITRGYTKSMLKGKVDMESLNMIAEAGVPIHSELAKSMGYGKDQMTAFFKAVSGGKVKTEDLNKAFQKMTSEGGLFFEGMIIASRTTSGVLSTLSDNLKMTAAGLGQELLPYIKEAALWLIKITSGFLTWIKTGDNLKNTLSALGYVISGLAAGLVIYAVAFGGLGTAIATASTAVKGFTAVLAANPIGAIAVLITAVLIPALIYMYNNWDKVKFKVKDFALSAQIKLLEFAEVINVKVLQAMANLYKSFAGVPGMGKLFGPMITKQALYTAHIHNSTKALKLQQQGARQEFKASQDQAKKDIETQKKQAKAIEEKNKVIIDGHKSRKQSFIQMLEEMTLASQGNAKVMEKQAMDFYVKRAEMESEDSSKRIEFLQQQSAIISNNKKLEDSKKIAAEQGLQRAIAKIQDANFQARVNYGKEMVSVVGSMMSDLSTIFKNAGKESRTLAIFMKGIAMAEAGINTALAFTKALASAPPPFNFIMAGAVAAAGLVKQIAIASTPIPTAETGINYTVPDTRSNQRDGHAVMATAGENVSITPRGQSGAGNTNINIQIDEDTIFRVVQKGISTGNIDVSDKNIGRGVFAT